MMTRGERVKGAGTTRATLSSGRDSLDGRHRWAPAPASYVVCAGDLRGEVAQEDYLPQQSECGIHCGTHHVDHRTVPGGAASTDK